MMLAAFGLAILHLIQLLGWSFYHLLFVDLRAFPKRLVLFVLGVPLFVALQAVHWVGFALDELLFPGYRAVKVDRPVFIVGIPRSGTTFLQRTLALDSGFTTTQTWECLFAPSITERVVLRAVGRLFSPLGKRLFNRSSGFLNQMDAIHELGLQEPEEDFLFFLPLFSCFILIAIFPEAAGLWRQAHFDQQLSPWEKRVTLSFYQRCVQKHLYVHGPQRRYLSKNPSFTSLLRSLNAQFPDARFIITTRSPLKTVPSQLSSLRPAFELTGSGRFSPHFQSRIIHMLHTYYETLAEVVPQLGEGIPILENKQMKGDLDQTLARIYAYIDQPQAADFYQRWNDLAAASSSYKSQHHYQLSDFDLTAADLELQFADVWPVTQTQTVDVSTPTAVNG